MKILKRIFVGAVMIIATLTMASCDLNFGTAIDNAVKSTVWPYSADGLAEINLNFDAIKSETYKGEFEWNVTVNTNGNLNTFSLKCFADKSGITKKQKFVYEKGATKLTNMAIGESNYYIDETNKTLSTTSNTSILAMMSPSIYALTYGVIEFTDDESQPTWTFVSKTDSVSVINSLGAAEDAVEYQYTSIEEANSIKSTKMLVDFKKVITPVIARLYYEVYENNTLKETITVYIILHVDEVITDATFAVPTEAEGYTIS